MKPPLLSTWKKLGFSIDFGLGDSAMPSFFLTRTNKATTTAIIARETRRESVFGMLVNARIGWTLQPSCCARWTMQWRLRQTKMRVADARVTPT
ncbi:hypothetical protein [Variovorax sp. GrIS 2.14]|uniref:hypothetical protein n=1 Tax=Variovorax sp. GrIS 2.14 TaxID=3071709 RepID=UPI0038F81401